VIGSVPEISSGTDVCAEAKGQAEKYAKIDKIVIISVKSTCSDW